MRALSLTQPWATLVALGEKRIETRSWSTNYRGRIAIHAAKGMPRWAREFAYADPAGRVLNEAGIYLGGNCRDLPKGAVVATANLYGVVGPLDAAPAIGDVWQAGGLFEDRSCWELTEQELAFGDYSAGRFAWLLEAVEPLSEPIPAKGALGLWEWGALGLWEWGALGLWEWFDRSDSSR